MNYSIRLHPDVIKYLDSIESNEERKCIESLRRLGENPLQKRPLYDMRKLKGKRRSMYRLRSGSHRFEYFIENRIVWVVDAFNRSRGYR